MGKLLQLCFFGFVTLTGQSILAEIIGVFESADNIKVEQEKEIIIISDVSTANRQRVKELKNNGFACEKVTQWYKCYKFNKVNELPSELDINIPDLDIVFKPITAIKNKREGESVTTFVADQEVLISGILYKGVRYIIHSNLVKAKVGIDSHSLQPMHFIFKDKQLGQIKTIRWHKSDTDWKQYIIRFLFKRIN